MTGKPKKMKRPRRTRQRFLKSLEQDDFDASVALLSGYIVVGDATPRRTVLRLVPRGSRDGFGGYEGFGKTPMEALRDAAWTWLDARKQDAPRPSPKLDEFPDVPPPPPSAVSAPPPAPPKRAARSDVTEAIATARLDALRPFLSVGSTEDGEKWALWCIRLDDGDDGADGEHIRALYCREAITDEEDDANRAGVEVWGPSVDGMLDEMASGLRAAGGTNANQ